MFLDFFCRHPSRFYGVLDGPSGPPLKKSKMATMVPKLLPVIDMGVISLSSEFKPCSSSIS